MLPINNKPIVLTSYALARTLKAFAVRMGMEDTFADVLAQVHTQQDILHHRWSEFLMNNCTNCSNSPDVCHYLNPTKEHCLPGTEPNDVKNATSAMIETGRVDNCPAISRISSGSEPINPSEHGEANGRTEDSAAGSEGSDQQPKE